jgi:hypothetical protein
MTRNSREKVKKEQRRARIEFSASLSPLSFFGAKCPSLLKPGMARIGLIQFDSLGFTLERSLCRRTSRKRPSRFRHPRLKPPIPGTNGLIRFDSLRFATIHRSPSLHSPPLPKTPQFGLIRFDSLRFATIHRSPSLHSPPLPKTPQFGLIRVGPKGQSLSFTLFGV